MCVGFERDREMSFYKLKYVDKPCGIISDISSLVLGMFNTEKVIISQLDKMRFRITSSVQVGLPDTYRELPVRRIFASNLVYVHHSKQTVAFKL